MTPAPPGRGVNKSASSTTVTVSIVVFAVIGAALIYRHGHNEQTAAPRHAAGVEALHRSSTEWAWTRQRDAREPGQSTASTRPSGSIPAASGRETDDIPHRRGAGAMRDTIAGHTTGAQSGSMTPDSVGAAIRADTALPARAEDSLFGRHGSPNDESAAATHARGDELALASIDPGLTYDSGSDAQFSTATRFPVPDSGSIIGDAGAISFSFEPQWSGDNQADADLVAIGDNQLRIFKNVHFLRFEMTDSGGEEVGTGANIADWEPVEPHQITATWGGGVMSLYVDAKLVAQQRYANPFEIPSGTPAYVGTDSQGALVAPGVIRNVQLWKQPLGPSEIANRYASAIPVTK